jgi:putative nucleotidyltransferase with HDIG domain
MARIVDDMLLWSGYPSIREVREVVEKHGVGLVVNLVDASPEEAEYYYVARSLGVEVVTYPIRDYGFAPPEDVHMNVLTTILRAQREGKKVLVHCQGGIGRSGTTVAMYLVLRHGLGRGEALARVRRLGGGPEAEIQRLALRWYERALTLLGPSGLDEILELGARYGFGWGISHASTVANIACDIAEQLGAEKEMLTELYIAGLLHDIGRAVSDPEDHHLRSAELVKESRNIIAKYGDPEAVAFLARNHRASTDPRKDPLSERLGKDYVLLASVLRLADTFRNIYDEEKYRGAKLRGKTLVIDAHRVDMYRLRKKAKVLEEPI